VLGFIASEESWCLIPVDVNDASVTRVKQRVGDVRRTTPFPLLARLLAPRKSVELIAPDKARSAAMFRNPTKAFEDRLAAGQSYILSLRGAMPVEGGLPIVVDGRMIGAIGVSGGSAQQDGISANAGAEALK
jgi:Haem degrading protein HbpS-like